MKIDSIFIIILILVNFSHIETYSSVASLDLDIDIYDTNFIQMKTVTKSKNKIRSLINANNAMKQNEASDSTEDSNRNAEYEYDQDGLDNNTKDFVSHAAGIDIVLEDNTKEYFHTDPTPVEIITPPFIPVTPSRETDDVKISTETDTTSNKTDQNINENKTQINTQSTQSNTINNTISNKSDSSSTQTTDDNLKRDETIISTESNLNNNSSYVILNYLYLVVILTLL